MPCASLGIEDAASAVRLQQILGPREGGGAVEAACAEALAGGTISRDVVLNILTRQRQPPAPLNIVTPEALASIMLWLE